MCVHIFEYACTEPVTFYHIGNKESGKAYSIVGELRGVDIVITIVVSDEERGEVVCTRAEVVLYGIASSFGEIHNTELASLTSYSEFECLEVHISFIQCCELRDTQAS